jgi:hypothetical protein
MFNPFKKPYVIIVINDDDTGCVQYVSSPPTYREKILYGVFLNMMGDGDFKTVPPGRYRFQMAHIGFPRFKYYDLIPAD